MSARLAAIMATAGITIGLLLIGAAQVPGWLGLTVGLCLVAGLAAASLGLRQIAQRRGDVRRARSYLGRRRP